MDNKIRKEYGSNPLVRQKREMGIEGVIPVIRARLAALEWNYVHTATSFDMDRRNFYRFLRGIGFNEDDEYEAYLISKLNANCPRE